MHFCATLSPSFATKVTYSSKFFQFIKTIKQNNSDAGAWEMFNYVYWQVSDKITHSAIDTT